MARPQPLYENQRIRITGGRYNGKRGTLIKLNRKTRKVDINGELSYGCIPSRWCQPIRVWGTRQETRVPTAPGARQAAANQPTHPSARMEPAARPARQAFPLPIAEIAVPLIHAWPPPMAVAETTARRNTLASTTHARLGPPTAVSTTHAGVARIPATSTSSSMSLPQDAAGWTEYTIGRRITTRVLLDLLANSISQHERVHIPTWQRELKVRIEHFRYDIYPTGPGSTSTE